MKFLGVLFILGAVAVSRNGAWASGNGDSSARLLEGSSGDNAKNEISQALAFLQAFMESKLFEETEKGLKNLGDKIDEVTHEVSNDAGEAFLKVYKPLEKIFKSAVQKGRSAVDNTNMHNELRKLDQDISSTLDDQMDGHVTIDYETAAYELGKGIYKIGIELKDVGGSINDVGSKAGVEEEALAKYGDDIRISAATLVEGLKAFANLLGKEASWNMKEIERQAAHIVKEAEKTTEETKRRVGDRISALRGAADKINRAFVLGYKESKDENSAN